jgi:hypothetical protein
VQLREPAVRGPLEDGGPAPGTEVAVRLETADVAARTVAFTAVASRPDGSSSPP